MLGSGPMSSLGWISQLLGSVFTLLCAGCTSAVSPGSPPTGDQDSPPGRALAPNSPTAGSSDLTRQAVTGDPVSLPSFAVNAPALSDFGMSVQTSIKVSWAGPAEWMRIGAVAPGSAAARANLLPGDRILATDGILITKLKRTQMLDRLFP